MAINTLENDLLDWVWDCTMNVESRYINQLYTGSWKEKVLDITRSMLEVENVGRRIGCMLWTHHEFRYKLILLSLTDVREI